MYMNITFVLSRYILRVLQGTSQAAGWLHDLDPVANLFESRSFSLIHVGFGLDEESALHWDDDM